MPFLVLCGRECLPQQILTALVDASQQPCIG